MGDFPSGQRGQTVNLLAMPSVVRIHHPPPEKRHTFRCVSFLLWCGFEPILMRYAGGISLRPVQTLVDTIIFSRCCERKCKSNPPSPIYPVTNSFQVFTQNFDANPICAGFGCSVVKLRSCSVEFSKRSSMRRTKFIKLTTFISVYPFLNLILFYNGTKAF